MATLDRAILLGDVSPARPPSERGGMSRSRHHQRPDLAAGCLRRLALELAKRGTPLHARERDSLAGRQNWEALGEEPPRVRRVVIDG